MDTREEYLKFADSEQNFNNIAAGIRNLASTWIITAFATIALLIKTGGGTSWLIPNAVLIGLVCLMATVGLVLLGINDQLVYRDIWSQIFALDKRK